MVLPRLLRRGLAPAVAVILALSTLGTVNAQATSRPTAPLAPAAGALFGAYVDPTGVWSGNAAQEDQITSFEGTIGRKIDVVQHYYGWTDAFPSGLEQWDLAGGRIPMISWQGSSLDSIISGAYDSMIRARADALKALGSPVFLRWCWEMNGNWYPCDGSHNNSPGQTDGPAKYVRAWRHIHDIFTAEGATNVVWVWCPNQSDVPSASWNHWTNYYPGDAYVDWVGVDGYNWGTTRSWSRWTSFASLFAAIYRDYSATKPLMIAETSSAEQGGSKAQWISDARAALESQFPSIEALLWFDVPKETSWQVDSSPTSLAAYTAMGADPYFSRSGGGGGGGTQVAITDLSLSPQATSRSTTVSFSLNEPASVSIEATNAQGTVVRHLLSAAAMPAGTSRVQWNRLRGDDGRQLSPGVYTIDATASTGDTQALATATLQITSGGHGGGAARTAISGLKVEFGPVVPTVRRTRISFRLPTRAVVFVQVRNSKGALVRTLRPRGTMRTGVHAFGWWGRTNSLHDARPGAYRIVVGATSGGRAITRVRFIRVAHRIR
jgi:endoglucanase